jgi:hypothetical protein
MFLSFTKKFSSKGESFIWAYDKKEIFNINGRIKGRLIRKVASEEFFYDRTKNWKFRT